MGSAELGVPGAETCGLERRACLVFTLELYTNIHVPRGPDAYTPVHLSIYLHLPKGEGQRKGRPEKRRKTKITGGKDHGELAKRAERRRDWGSLQGGAQGAR